MLMRDVADAGLTQRSHTIGSDQGRNDREEERPQKDVKTPTQAPTVREDDVGANQPTAAKATDRETTKSVVGSTPPGPPESHGPALRDSAARV